MSDPAVTLYRLQACPFCERVVRKLDEFGLEYRSRFVEPMHSERDVVKRISGKRTVPAIVDEERVVQYAWVAQEWPDFPDYDEVGAVLADL